MSLLVVHAARTEGALCHDLCEKFKLDIKKARKEGNSLLARLLSDPWRRFAIIPEGMSLVEKHGTPTRPHESAVKLDRDGLITQSLLQESLNALASDTVRVGRLEYHSSNPFLGIDRPYYEVAFKVSGR